MQEKSDAELLREYASQASEAAFREIVRRHADLVYASALRQVRSPELAHDIAQTVFADLVHKAAALGQTLDDNASLVGWLYRSTRFEAHTQLRDDRRRQARERQAMENHEFPSETATEWERVGPVLDEAMADLSDEDRDALLLRFFKNHDFCAIGAALGVSDDAAQKRVSRALERLRAEFNRRGVTTTAIALSAAVSAHAVAVGPAGLAATLSTAALTGTTLAAATTATATKVIAMTTTQKTLIAVALGAAVGTGIYKAREASTLRTQVQMFQQQQVPIAEQLQQLTKARAVATRQLAALREDNERLNRNTAELLRLRGEVGRLRSSAQDSKQVESDSIQIAAKSWLAKVDVLKKWIEQRPEQTIPEFQYLQDYDWLDAVKTSNMLGDYAPMNAMRGLREAAKRQFAHEMSNVLRHFVEEHNGDLPADLSQLNAYFQKPMNDAVLKSYKLLHSGKLADLPNKEWIVEEIAPPFDDYDDRHMMIGTDSSVLAGREK